MDDDEKKFLCANKPELAKLTIGISKAFLEELTRKEFLSSNEVEKIQRIADREGRLDAAFEMYDLMATRTGAFKGLISTLEEYNMKGAANLLGKHGVESSHTVTEGNVQARSSQASNIEPDLDVLVKEYNDIIKAGGKFNVNVTRSSTNNAMHKKCYYKLPQSGKGLVLIINIIQYEKVNGSEGDPSRIGAEQDGKYMRDLFLQMGYKIFRDSETSQKRHWSKQDLIATVQDFRDECDAEDPPKSIIICIGAHGEHDTIQTSEAPDLIYNQETQQYSPNFDKCKVNLYEDVILYFGNKLKENQKGSKFLNGIPKLFLVNACQKLPVITEGLETKRDALYKTLDPPFGHTLLALSQVPGFFSYRSQVSGSWFFHCVAYVFMKKAYTTDVEEMLNIVKKILKHRIVPEECKVEYCQNPNIQNWSLEKLYFNI